MSRHHVTPHPDGDRLAEQALSRAQRLACAVRDSIAAVDDVTRGLDRDELVALAVALAALVDIERPASDLLTWLELPAPERASARHPYFLPAGYRFQADTWTTTDLRTAHAAWCAGDRDQWTKEGERVYQRRAYLRRKAARDQARKAA